MEWMARLSDAHQDIPERELKEVVKAEDPGAEFVEKMGGCVRFRSNPLDFSRLSFTKEVCRLVEVFELEEGFDFDIDMEGSFAVRAVNLDGEGRNHIPIESKIGKIIEKASGMHVDLDNSQNVFKAYIHSGEIYLSLLEASMDPGEFEARKNHLRPFSRPVSLHPRLARAIVNLAGITSEARVLDPFCGTGGILIEAGLTGMEVSGLDIDSEMVEGARINTSEYGVDADIRQGSIDEAPEIFDKRFDAIVTDMPYGKASFTSGEKKELLEALIQASEQLSGGNLVFMSDEEELKGLTSEFEIYVHRSLSRYVYILD